MTSVTSPFPITGILTAFFISGNDIPVRTAAVKLLARPPIRTQTRLRLRSPEPPRPRFSLCASFQPARILSVTGFVLAETTASTTRRASFRFAHQRLLLRSITILGTGQPIMISNSTCLRSLSMRGASAMISGSWPNLVGTGASPSRNLQQSVGICPCTTPLGADHFRADQPRPFSPQIRRNGASVPREGASRNGFLKSVPILHSLVIQFPFCSSLFFASPHAFFYKGASFLLRAGHRKQNAFTSPSRAHHAPRFPLSKSSAPALPLYPSRLPRACKKIRRCSLSGFVL